MASSLIIHLLLVDLDYREAVVQYLKNNKRFSQSVVVIDQLNHPSASNEKMGSPKILLYDGDILKVPEGYHKSFKLVEYTSVSGKTPGEEIYKYRPFDDIISLVTEGAGGIVGCVEFSKPCKIVWVSNLFGGLGKSTLIHNLIGSLMDHKIEARGLELTNGIGTGIGTGLGDQSGTSLSELVWDVEIASEKSTWRKHCIKWDETHYYLPSFINFDDFNSVSAERLIAAVRGYALHFGIDVVMIEGLHAMDQRTQEALKFCDIHVLLTNSQLPQSKRRLENWQIYKSDIQIQEEVVDMASLPSQHKAIQSEQHPLYLNLLAQWHML